MEIFPISFFFLAFLALSIRKGQTARVYMFTIAIFPFGMASFANLTFAGNLALPLAQIGVAAAICLVLFKKYRKWVKYRNRFDTLGILRTLRSEETVLLIFSVYAVFSGIFFSRIFEGEFSVFSFRLNYDGVSVGPFSTTIVELAPSASNFSQSFYIVLSVAFFFLSRGVIARNGLVVPHKALVVAAAINIVLGSLDYMSFDSILAYVRTASYALLNTHELHGMARVVGGFPEASSFGTFSVSVGIYFLVCFIRRGRLLNGVLACANLVFAVSSLSSTAFFGVGCAAILLFIGFLFQVIKNHIQLRAVTLFLIFSLIVFCIAFYFAIASIPAAFQGIFYSLVTNKSESLSALERGAWAAFALRAFSETYMLGAGVGSLRGNGWVSVYLGSVGLIGSLLILYFLLRTLCIERFGQSLSRLNCNTMDIVVAARTSAITMVAMGCISATTPDLGLLLMLFCAITSSISFHAVDKYSMRNSYLESEYLKSFYRK